MPKIDIQCNPSSVFTLILIFLALASISIIFCLSISGLSKLSLIIIMLSYIIDNISQYARLTSNKSILKVQLLANNDWQLTTSQQTFLAKLRPESMTNRFFSVLLFKVENKRFFTVSLIPRSSIDEQNYRNLLVYLRMKT